MQKALSILTAGISLLIALPSFAQHYPQPGPGPVYDDAQVARIDILIDADSLAAILDPNNAQSNHEYPASFIFSANGSSDTLHDIGFRLRGNTSRYAAKKSFKVAINSFTPGRRYKDLKKINLNGEHNDPSISRARICWELGRKLGLPVSRVSHTEVYINQQYYGLYINLEHINDDWLALRFGNNGGNLYKCVWPADLDYISQNPDDYKFTRSDGRRAYELKTNEAQDDYSDLAQFIHVLNNTALSQLRCALDPIFDIEGFLQILAFEVATGHWDNYAYNKNNYYLYNDPQSGKFHFIPYDMDNTLGVDWLNENWATRDVHNWPNPGLDLPLAQRLLQLPELKEIYLFYLRDIQNELSANATALFTDSIKNQISAYAQTDSFRTFDYGFTYTDFLQSFSGTQSLGHVKQSIGDYIIERGNNTTQQLGNFDVAPILRREQIQFIGQNGQAQLLVHVEDEDANPHVELEYSLNGGSQQSITLLDDGMHGDGMANDGLYGGSISNLPNAGQLVYQFIATDSGGKSRQKPCQPKTVSILLLQDLVINEFMADNDNTIPDEDGDYSDWIELYNNSTDSIWLGNYFLTDELGQPFKWQLPDSYLHAGDFQLIWASNKDGIHPWHTNFALSKNGEEIGLFQDLSGQIDTADHIFFGAQQEDISFGRSYDASPQWISFSTPTPNASNGTLSAEEPRLDNHPNLLLYPNPADDHIRLQWHATSFKGHAVHIRLVDIHGAELLEIHFDQDQQEGRISIEHLPAGVYFLQLQTDDGNYAYQPLLIKR